MSKNRADSTRSRRWRRLGYRLEYVFYRGVRWIAGLLSQNAARHLGAVVGLVAWVVDARHRKVALENLGLAMPERSVDERKRLVRLCFQQFGGAILDTLAGADRSAEEFYASASVEGWSHMEAAEAAGRGVLILTAHLGYWEAAGQYLAARGMPLAVVARPLDNPLLEREMRRLRERYGNITIRKREAARGMLKALRSPGRVAILLDQRVHPNEGKAYPFFDNPAYTSSLLARLSLRTGAPVVPGFGLQGRDGKDYHIVVRPPIWPDSTDATDAEAVDRLTERYLEALEREIRLRPELWLWMHRRWRKSPTLFPRRETTDAAPAEAPRGARRPG